MDEVGIREMINELKNMAPEVEGAIKKLAELAELDQCPDEFDLKSHCERNGCIACWFKAVTEETNLPKTPGEAYEAGLREGDKRTVERIAEMMAREGLCVDEESGHRDSPHCVAPKLSCRDHWLQYLTEDSR